MTLSVAPKYFILEPKERSRWKTAVFSVSDTCLSKMKTDILNPFIQNKHQS